MNTLLRYGATQQRLKEAADYPGLRLGRVLSQYKNLYKIAEEAGERLAVPAGRLLYETTDATGLPAVGDFVMADGTDDAEDQLVIRRVLKRTSCFTRMAAGGEHETQVVAANIDTVFLCMSLNNNYNLNRLERYLAVAWDSGATPVVVLTKADLCEDLPGALSGIASAAPGTDVVVTSAKEASGSDGLRPYLRPGVTVAFIGSSGVGKSTLINGLLGEERLDTAAIGSEDRGRHTTTRRELLLLPSGGVVIDTPGMRELGIDSADLGRAFSDIDALAAECRFSDCAHTTEPGCAVRRAVEAGRLDERRLESYRKLKREARYDGLSARQRETEKLTDMFKDVGGMKKVRKYIRQNDKRTGDE